MQLQKISIDMNLVISYKISKRFQDSDISKSFSYTLDKIDQINHVFEQSNKLTTKYDDISNIDDIKSEFIKEYFLKSINIILNGYVFKELGDIKFEKFKGNPKLWGCPCLENIFRDSIYTVSTSFIVKNENELYGELR